jgi:hypothetical protein
MKESIIYILDRYEKVKEKFNNPDNYNIELNEKEATLFHLVHYFQTENYPVLLNSIVEHLEDDYLLDAIQAIILFVQKDMTKTRGVSQSFYDTNLLKEKFYGQKTFAEAVEAAIPGHKYKASMVNTYFHRGSDRIANADIIIGNTPYWRESTLQKFIAEERIRYEKNKEQSK